MAAVVDNNAMVVDDKNEIEEALIHNMIEEFMNISDEDNKIFNLLKEEFKDLKILHYGSIMFIQNEDDILIPSNSCIFYQKILQHIYTNFPKQILL